ncbi:MAG: Lipid flippase MurJ [Planctomycetota bacterium]|jgi:putative peptidoglycan lipid II flippase
MAEHFERHARTSSILTFVSRITGLVRDAALASVFGISPFTDAFNFAFQIPNLFRRLFGEGAISAAFVPRYTELVRDDPERARRYAGLMLGFLAILLCAIVVVGEIALFWLWSSAPAVEVAAGVPVHAGGVVLPTVGTRYARLAYELAAIMLPYMPLVCLVAVGGSALQTHGRFGPTAGSPILLNLFMIAAMLGLYPLVVAGSIDPETHLRVLALSVLAAGLLQLAWIHAALRAVRPVFAPGDGAVRGLVRATLLGAGPLMLGLGVLQVNIVVDGLIASWPSIVGPTILGIDYPLEEGAMTALTNAARLYEFPLGVFGISIATAIFPALSRQNNDAPAFMATLRRGLRLTMFIGLPASAGLMLVSREAVGVLFQRGAFGPEETERVAFVLLGFAPAIWAYQANHILTRAFYARKEPITPVKVAVAMVGLNLALNVTLIFTPLREAGLAASTSVCAVVQAAILARVLSRTLRRESAGAMVDRAVAGSVARSATATACMVAAVLAAGALLPDAEGVRGMAVSLAVKVGVGAAAYLAVARVLAPEELRAALGRRAS